MRKYLFNGAIIGAATGAISLVRTTAKGPRDWKLALMWVSWGLSLAIAIGTTAQDSKKLEAEGK
ncbi:hypothetical protein OSC27_07050 [Microbacterium sp. STN6]|uniref:hypothetical protein n=1 Tax=Microbacterium sp. STN6 TaxID=2995588 RepID=UPI0022608987|nr:hypothetical protein [Microbacterium sp. STN6]MCX7522034.1 hypothetical protein [Microbacterium sp. STN6]